MTKLVATPIYCKKPLEVFFSGNKGPTWAWYAALRIGPNKVCSNEDLRFTLTFVTTRSN